MADLCLLPVVLFILGSGRPLPRAECALGLDFNQMGPWQSCPWGPHQSNAPLRMINEPTYSRNAAQLLCGANTHGARRGCSHQSQHSVTEELPLPQCQIIAWHSPAPGRHMQERWCSAGPTAVLLLRVLRLPGTWKSCLFLLSRDRFLCQHLLALTMGDILFCSQAPWLRSYFRCLTSVEIKAFATPNPR